MGKQVCSWCGESYYVNPDVDYEFACPKCGFVEAEFMVGQKTGSGSNLFHD